MVKVAAKQRKLEATSDGEMKVAEGSLQRLWTSKWLVGIAGVALVLGFVVGCNFPQIWREVKPFFGFKKADELDFSSLQEVYDELVYNFDGALDKQQLLDGAKKGLVAAAGDPYTAYMTAAENREFQASLSGDVGAGIGIELALRDGRLLILRTLPDNPAVRAGVQKFDEVIMVNDEDVEGKSAEYVAAKVRGSVGSEVKLVVRRSGVEKVFTLVREKINNLSVIAEYNDGVALVHIYRFDKDTGSLMRKVAEKIRSDNIRKIVLDLRGNGGGYVQAAQEVAGLWLKNQVVLTERTATGERTLRSIGADQTLAGRSTVVLIDGGTASASEILAAALHDHGAASLVGEVSFGKGSMQSQVGLSNGGLLKVTIARWLTPNGVDLSKNGIVPDTEIEMTIDDVNALRDPQLEAALKAV
ncbi:MAG: S41 family peptidase [Candidatus Nomurabacteria bacterium]|jgi:carboxyl-terminal processing protease|nr:S41 family peptidase [Candidatus Nomurabacteria bacterium]